MTFPDDICRAVSTDGVALAARAHVLDALKSDIRRVKQALTEFRQLDPSDDSEARRAVVSHVLDELTVHAALEQELLYPVLRAAMPRGHVVDEAVADQARVQAQILMLRTLRVDAPGFDKHFCALCEEAVRHTAWEETHLFSGLDGVAIDWPRLEGEMDQRREELVVSEWPVDPA
jgi:hypothetical protein